MSVSGISAPPSRTPSATSSKPPEPAAPSSPPQGVVPDAVAFALVQGTAPPRSFAAALVQKRPDRQPEQPPPITFPDKDPDKDKVANDKPGRVGARPWTDDEAGTPGRGFPTAATRARPRAKPPGFASSAFMAHSLTQQDSAPEPTAQAMRAAVAAYGRGIPATPPGFGEILAPMPRLASGRMVDLAV